MKKKSLLRMGAVLLSYGFMINAMNVNTGMVVMAEEFSADEDTEPEDTTDQDIAGLTDGEENTEDTEDTAYGNAENQNVEETQELLKLCGMAQLYPKLKRDAIIYYGLQHKLNLFEINDKLFDENEETLF